MSKSYHVGKGSLFMKRDPHSAAELNAQLDRDNEDEAIEEVLGECVDIYIATKDSEDSCTVATEGLRAVLHHAYKKWQVGEF